MQTYLTDIVRTFNNQKTLADAAFAQVGDEDFFRLIDPDANSIAVIVQHLAGNLRSRFTDFLTSDGEKPTRNRDSEFESPAVARAALLDAWNDAWRVTLDTVRALEPADLERTVYIRSEAFAVLEALNRSATHVAYHVWQIVLLAKHFAGPRWTSLSIPKGKSAEHNVGGFKRGIIAGRTPLR